MADIFQSFSRTLAHLGDDVDNNNDTKRAFDDLAMIYDMLQMEGALINILLQIDPELGYSLRKKVDLEAIGTIIGRSYFQRIWVVQEAVLSKKTTFLCGEQSISFNTLVAATTWLLFNSGSWTKEGNMVILMDKNERIFTAFSFMTITNQVLRGYASGLMETLQSSRALRCSDPRDRIFGLLSLVKSSPWPSRDTSPTSLVPDYTKSAADLYCDVTKACMTEYDVFWEWESYGYEQSPDHIIEDLPTWIPTWYYSDEKLVTVRAEQLPPRASLWLDEDTKRMRIDTETSVGRVLSVRGMVVEVVETQCCFELQFTTDLDSPYIAYLVNSFLEESRDLLIRSRARKARGWRRALCSLFPMPLKSSDIRRLSGVLSAGSPDVDVFELYSKCHELVWSAASAQDFQSMWTEFHESAFDQTQELGARVTTIMTLESTIRVIESSSQDETEAYPHANYLLPRVEALLRFYEAVKYCRNRTLFMTRSGYLGIGPRGLQKGDAIAISKLSQWPMVLRPAYHLGCDHYSMIGAAYVERYKGSGEELFAIGAELGGVGTINLV